MKEKSQLLRYLLAFAVGLGLGYNFIPSFISISLYFLLALVCIVFAFQNKVEKFLTLLPYLIYTEVYFRAFYRNQVPYLTIQYAYLICFLVLAIRYAKSKQPHNKTFTFIVLFALLEIVNGFFPNNQSLYKATLTNTFSLVLGIIWASYYRFSPMELNKILSAIKKGSVLLCGIIIVAHIKGGINYGTFSSSDASNGMAPVQISGYLGFGSSLMFIAIMSPLERKKRVLNVLIFILVTVLMVLTLSRGGLYFLSAVAIMYLFFNRARLGNYFKYLLLLPIVSILFNFVVDQTQGVVLKRYNEEGSSNRDMLVYAAIDLFLKYPVFGVGTSNFASAVVKEKLFFTQSTAHNEFARAMAEHGVFGIITYWGFFISTAFAIWKRKEPNRQFSYYFLALFCFISIHNGLKISVQQLLLVLAIGNPSFVNQYIQKSKNELIAPSNNNLQQSA